jgi:hypothetical protein
MHTAVHLHQRHSLLPWRIVLYTDVQDLRQRLQQRWNDMRERSDCSSFYVTTSNVYFGYIQ